MELRHLRYFMAVAEELHFGRAADKLCIAQPPLSQQIQQLERELGFALFLRSSRKVELTEAGRSYLDEVRALISGLEKAAQHGRRIALGEVGTLAIGFVGTATYSVLPAVLRKYRIACPDIHLTLRELVSARQAQALRDRRIQVGFARPAVAAADIVCEVIISEPFAAALPEKHPFAASSTIPLNVLAEEEFVLFPADPKPSYGDLVRQICGEVGFQPRVSQEAAEIQTAISLVAGGLGVTLVPASASRTHREGVVFVPLAEPAPSSDLCIVFRNGDDSPALQAFLNVVREVKQDAIGAGIAAGFK